MWRSSHVEYIPLGPIDTTSPQPLYSATTRPPTSFRRILPTLRLLALPLTLITLYFLLPLLLNRARPTPPSEYLSHAGTSVLETTIVLPKLQYNFANSQGGDDERRQKVKESIKRTWDLYVQQAWGWDEVRPIRGGGHDTRNGWGATIVDGLTTLIIAGLQEEFLAALEYTVSIDFTAPDGLVNPFETIIRYVGGLVSTVDLLELHFDSLDSQRLVEILRQAEILVHKLSPGLDSPMRMWYNNVDFSTSRGISEELWGDAFTSPAQAGTNFLEYGRLSELTRDVQYVNNATGAWWPLVNPKQESVIPGMIAQPVSIETGESHGDDIQWGAGQDSFYEYLIKSFILWPNPKTELYRDRWVLAVENTMKFLSSWSLPTAKNPSFRYLASHDGRKKNEMGHLTCFAPGNFLLGGRALNREDIFQFGLDVLEGCWHTYKVTPNGISPERWSWQSNDTVDKPYGHRSYTEWENYGIWTVDGEYYLRPETIESYFYAYRLTGNKIYQDRAWDAFQRISKVTEAPFGYSAIRDIMIPGARSKRDEQESFWLAETLKYLFLIFDDPARISLDEWVFNTEAHPLRRERKVEWGN